MLLIIIAHLTS